MSVGQYLQHYAEPEALAVNGLNFYYDHLLAIPAFNEPESFLNRVSQLNIARPVLVILVLNAPDNLDSNEKLLNTQALGQSLKSNYPELQKFTENIRLLELNNEHSQHLLLVERCEKQNLIPAKEGVGLARKIACDIACRFIAEGRIVNPWIHTTDADVDLPQNYFEASKHLSPTEEVAAIYPFKHKTNNNKQLQQCQQLYDLSLYYYVEGLAHAGSLYAFQTIGSTIVINFHAYALVRGFPKRAAGEDFYLLNKLAKLGDIVSLASPVIDIDSRKSDRVPFGTGPALSKISQLDKPSENYDYYQPLCFDYLKAFLLFIPKLWEQEEQCLTLSPLKAEMARSTLDPQVLLSCLESLGIEKALNHAYSHSKTLQLFERHMLNWFDAFKTLKFIHYMRDALIDKGHSKPNVSQLLRQGDFLSDKLKEKINEVLILPQD